jgi:hypothetical protein
VVTALVAVAVLVDMLAQVDMELILLLAKLQAKQALVVAVAAAGVIHPLVVLLAAVLVVG